MHKVCDTKTLGRLNVLAGKRNYTARIDWNEDISCTEGVTTLDNMVNLNGLHQLIQLEEFAGKRGETVFRCGVFIASCMPPTEPISISTETTEADKVPRDIVDVGPMFRYLDVAADEYNALADLDFVAIMEREFPQPVPKTRAERRAFLERLRPQFAFAENDDEEVDADDVDS